MLIRLENLYKIYHPGPQEVRALDGVSLSVEAGEFVAIVGHSGSGKSTLMNMLGCLDTPTSGAYFLEGRDVSRLRDDELSEIRNVQIGFIFQGFNLIPGLDALENVELPLLYRGIGKSQRRQRQWMHCGGWGWRNASITGPAEMSVGQQQRLPLPGDCRPSASAAGGRTHRKPGYPLRSGGYGYFMGPSRGGPHHHPHHP